MKKNKPPKLKPSESKNEVHNIIFSFKYYYGEHYLKDFKPKQIYSMLSDLKALSSKTLKEAMSLRKETNLGYETISRNSLKRYPSTLPQDTDIHVFRIVNQKARLLCLHEEKTSILHVLVIDFDFDIYKH